MTFLCVSSCSKGFPHHYHLDESIFSFKGGIGSYIFMIITFLDENQASKEYCPRWDAAFCGVASGYSVWLCPKKKGVFLMWVENCCWRDISNKNLSTKGKCLEPHGFHKKLNMIPLTRKHVIVVFEQVTTQPVQLEKLARGLKCWIII